SLFFLDEGLGLRLLPSLEPRSDPPGGAPLDAGRILSRALRRARSLLDQRRWSRASPVLQGRTLPVEVGEERLRAPLRRHGGGRGAASDYAWGLDGRSCGWRRRKERTRLLHGERGKRSAQADLPRRSGWNGFRQAHGDAG